MKVFGSTKQSYLFQHLPRAIDLYQLDFIDLDKTKRIANVRIHIERVIGILRQKYTVLQGTLPIDFLSSNGNKCPVIDRIVRVCSALTNLCPTIIPFD